jgi:hypothetical protein
MRHSLLPVSVLLLLGMIVSGCAYWHGKTPQEASPAVATLLPCPPNVGDQCREIDGEDIDGAPFKLSDYRGKVVLLDFWGTW